MEKFTVNGKTYVLNRELDFSYLVMLDKNDIKVTNITGLAAINCFFQYVSGLTEEQASEEITQHVIKGGKLDDVINVYAKALEESGFFRTLMEQTTTGQENMAEASEEDSTKKSTRRKAVATE